MSDILVRAITRDGMVHAAAVFTKDTVDAAVCCLDSINYLLYPSDVKRMLKRLHLFVSPGGMLIFDINTPHKLKNLDNQVFLDEKDDVYCVWRTEYEKRSRIVTYGMDIFQRRADGAWDRSGEEHYERAHTVEELTLWLQEAGFYDIRTYGELKMRAPKDDEQRIFFTCINATGGVETRRSSTYLRERDSFSSFLSLITIQEYFTSCLTKGRRTRVVVTLKITWNAETRI